MQHSYNWKQQREKKAFLALEDGTILSGYSVGAPVDKVGEVVFNTGMTGYQEILSDPSYAGQFVTMTYPEIGNYGFNHADMESRQLFLNGFIIHNINDASNWRSESTLSDVLRQNDTPAIAGLDTRELTTKLRSSGTLKGFLHCSNEAISEKEAVAKAKAWCGLDNQDYASKVSCTKKFHWDPDGSLTASWGVAEELPPVEHRIVAYDFGIKWNILRCLRLQGMDVTVVPAQTPASEVLALKPDGVFFSNGPADPAAVKYAVNAGKDLIGKVPIMGICLGNQLLSLACGASTFRLKFGHHGCNHPVKNLATGAVEITSQNHNFGVDAETIPECLEVTHINLNDNTVEGVRHKTEPMFAVQYHPEAAPGPRDPHYLFDNFKEMMSR
ncbi:glutamine-hydrolyzing carbamoyl-phosphate synthase small subunit [Lentisphaerota bacterium ZTH]|nr:glutamine-hydrolyzing carbamoyl-phosphate synthase small subunit [Lentisphaerota bacterium]WET07042.1 glutamine-hydrolyzing carbamoyl-phosphate synthase small subunit [Lentisphaerota bacterium ZTH]